MGVRRVVTGHDEDGAAVFVSDERIEAPVAALFPGLELTAMWGGEYAPSFPDDGTMPEQPTWFPPVGGFRFAVITLPPSGVEPPADLDVDAAVAEANVLFPGLLDHNEDDDPGMHTTDTIDFEYIVSGEVVLELDDGAKIRLRPGDTVVQNGTRHRWSNPGTEPAVMVVFMCGAHHSVVNRLD